MGSKGKAQLRICHRATIINKGKLNKGQTSAPS